MFIFWAYDIAVEDETQLYHNAIALWSDKASKELRQYLTEQESQELERALRDIVEYDIKEKDYLPKFLYLQEEIDEIAKDPTPTRVALADIRLTFLKRLSPKKPATAYETVEELKRRAIARKAEHEAKLQRQRARERLAEAKMWEYNDSLNDKIAHFAKTLSAKTQGVNRYFRKLNDTRFMGFNFSHLMTDKQGSDELVQSNIEESTSDLSNFLTYQCHIYYLALPYAEYSLEDIPYLDFWFHVFVLAETGFWLNSAKVAIDGYVFDLPLVERELPDGYGYYRAKLDTRKFLGFGYRLFTSNELGESGYYFWQTVPCMLVQGLMQGDLEPEGSTIIDAGEGDTTYIVDGFEDEIVIPEDFSQYLKELGSWNSLVEKGIISHKIVPIVEKAMSRPQPASPEVPDIRAGDYEDIVSALQNLGSTKVQANEAARYVVQQFPTASLEEKIKQAIKYLST